MNTEAGRVFKPTKFSPEGERFSPRGDVDGRLKRQKSGAEEMTPERRRRSLERLTNHRNALWGRAGGETE
ncbi:hypothetical protein NDU88_002442 [Pleurodeles waltl]|uniref:Uncharacterized protein n=1 Tax=Pleurodeles waltl TaxID=8319 RepID=A0AAV7WQ72_PLEWA|nr:hypothetical protein NDU88_002442 [Pleurodeles waltl]